MRKSAVRIFSFFAIAFMFSGCLRLLGSRFFAVNDCVEFDSKVYRVTNILPVSYELEALDDKAKNKKLLEHAAVERRAKKAECKETA